MNRHCGLPLFHLAWNHRIQHPKYIDYLSSPHVQTISNVTLTDLSYFDCKLLNPSWSFDVLISFILSNLITDNENLAISSFASRKVSLPCFKPSHSLLLLCYCHKSPLALISTCSAFSTLCLLHFFCAQCLVLTGPRYLKSSTFTTSSPGFLPTAPYTQCHQQTS